MRVKPCSKLWTRLALLGAMLFAVASPDVRAAEPALWTELTPKGAAEAFAKDDGIYELTAFGNAFLARTSERQLIQSTDQGKTWKLVNAQLPEGSGPLVVGKHLFILGKTGHRSADGGKSWEPVLPPAADVWRAATDGKRLFAIAKSAASSRSLIATSTDGGKTITQGDIPSRSYWEPVVVGADGVLAKTERNTLVRSADGGRTWTDDRADPKAGKLARAGDAVLLRTNKTFHVSTDLGATWSSSSDPAALAANIGELATLKDAIFAEYTGGLLRSLDGGKTWERAGIFPDRAYSLQVAATNKTLLVWSGGKLRSASAARMTSAGPLGATSPILARVEAGLASEGLTAKLTEEKSVGDFGRMKRWSVQRAGSDREAIVTWVDFPLESTVSFNEQDAKKLQAAFGAFHNETVSVWIKGDPKAAQALFDGLALASCPAGQQRTADDVHCCWPGQRFDAKRGQCAGTPKCPEGHVRVEARCVAQEICEGGRVQASDGIHCCWAGQRWDADRSACAGVPTSCPEGATLVLDDCLDLTPAGVPGAMPAALAAMTHIPIGSLGSGVRVLQAPTPAPKEILGQRTAVVGDHLALSVGYVTGESYTGPAVLMAADGTVAGYLERMPARPRWPRVEGGGVVAADAQRYVVRVGSELRVFEHGAQTPKAVFRSTEKHSSSFGTSVALQGDRLLVGAPFEGGGGQAYLFDLTSGTLARTFKVAGTSGFGFYVAFWKGEAVVGAVTRSPNRTRPVYLFAL